MRILMILSLIALGAAFDPALAAPATIAGLWSGSGTISHRGNADAVRCRARFTKVGGASFEVSSQCTTDTGRYDVSGRVNASGGNRYSGWVETNSRTWQRRYHQKRQSPLCHRHEPEGIGQAEPIEKLDAPRSLGRRG